MIEILINSLNFLIFNLLIITLFKLLQQENISFILVTLLVLNDDKFNLDKFLQ